ncbi:MAG TPA: glycosyltransferase family 4 protein [Candidatus Acidoferrales bacterium]|nr:glycosyltransferase family 4 protein [Candidatus Acidoferrales bacterium]
MLHRPTGAGIPRARGKLKILLVHDFYQQPGGEDEVFRAERELLETNGHAVSVYARHNDEIGAYTWPRKAGLPLRTAWAWDSAAEIRELIQRDRPDVAHFHNTFPLISPAAYYACHEAGVPIVQSLHNPRLMCPAGTLRREGRVCQECAGRSFAWPAVVHGCYRQSRTQTAVVAGMLALHNYRKSWRLVDRYIVFSRFYRRMFVRAGFPAEKLEVKPHFVAPDPGLGTRMGRYALYVGRLAPEKGTLTLLAAWQRLSGIPLRIRGEGPLASNVLAAGSDQIELVPRLSREQLIELYRGARFLVWPSEGQYETFGLVCAEAFACGVPVIAARSGAMAEMVQDGETGLHFTMGDAADLAAKVEWAWHRGEEVKAMGLAARAEYEAKYTPEANYERLLEIYRAARGESFERGDGDHPSLSVESATVEVGPGGLCGEGDRGDGWQAPNPR